MILARYGKTEKFTPTQICPLKHPHDKAMLNIIYTKTKHVLFCLEYADKETEQLGSVTFLHENV